MAIYSLTGNNAPTTQKSVYSFSNPQSVSVRGVPVGADASSESYNNGGFLGGLGYLGEKVAVGFMSSIEGIWDYAAGGLAKLFGADDWAEQQFANDWFGDWYSHPEEWYNPSDGWRTAGDIAGGIGTSLPSILASIGAVAIAVGTAGAGTPISAGVLSAIGGGTAAVTAGLGAAGTSTKQAYLESGQLTGKEFGYGALSGVTEGALEGVTTALSLGTGQIVKSVAGSFAKETAKTVAKQSVVKTLTKGFIGEAFEEGMAEVLDPVWQRLTYNPNAKNATPQEVAYAAFVGGMSGMLMGGAGAVYNSGNSFLKGNSLVGRGLDAEVVGLSQQLAAFETANNTGDETFQNIAQTYADLARSLETTGGKVTTVTQKKLLGDLQRANTVAVFKPMIAKSAANIVNNAEAIAERLNAYGYKTADGKPITFTADQLRAGVDVNRPSSFSEALKTNSILRELAIADTTGHLVMDTARFEQATLMGKRLASQVDLNRFIETATPSEISAVSQALGIENWATLDADTFNQKITSFVENGGVQQYADRRATVQSIQAIPAETARPMPKMVNLRQDGSVRYSDGSTQIAITRQGDAYTVYDYASGHLSKNMTRSEVNKLLRDYNTQQADITAGARAQMEAESELRRQAEELDTYARENITDYSKLSAPNQSMIRKVIREGRAKGMSDEDVLAYAKISAHAGIDISFDKKATFRGHDEEGNEKYADGFYDPKTNRIVVNPEAKRSNERLLLHELEHTIIRGKEGSKYFKKLVKIAFDNMSEQERNDIIDRYGNFYQDKELSPDEIKAIIVDEISAHFSERLSNRHTLEKLVEAEPSLKDKILSFFKGASEDYKSVPKLSRAARSYYKTYKKLFDEFAEKNFQNNSAELRKTPVKNTETDSMHVTGDNDEEVPAITNTNVRYAIKYPSFSEADISSNMDAIADMGAVATIDASKLEKTGKSPMDTFNEYFNSLGNNIASETFGDIALPKSSAKSEIRHGITAEKIASIEAIPAVIEQGKVIFHKAKEGGVERIVVCAPIKIGEADYYMGVMLQRDARYQRLYLHNVVSVAIEREATSSSKDNLVTTGALEDGNHLSITSIIQKALNVKAEKQKSANKPAETSSDKRFALQIGDTEVSTTGRYQLETDTETLLRDISEQNSIEHFMPEGLSADFIKAIRRSNGFAPYRLYRGMEAAEMDYIIENGFIKSNSSYNFTNQQGQTRFSPQIQTALSYATGFAPAGIRERFFEQGLPAYIVEVGNYADLNFVNEDTMESYTKKEIDTKYITRVIELTYDAETKKVKARDIQIDGMNQAEGELLHGVPSFVQDKVTGTILYEHQDAEGYEDGKYISEKNPDILFDFDMVEEQKGMAFDYNGYLGISGDPANLVPYKADGRRFALDVDTDADYMTAVEAGDTEKARQMVERAARAAGYKLHAYHGTNAEFTKFDLRKHGGKNGKGEGYGIYLAANREIAAPYGKNVIDSYTKFNRLAEGREKTLTYGEVKKLVKRSCELDAKRLVDYGEYDSISEALKDTWVSNVVYTYDYSSIERVYADVALKLWQENDNDGDIINEIMTLSGAHYDYNNALRFYETVLTPTTNIDGFHYIWGNKDGSGEQNDIYLAFNSEQVKSADPVTYDGDGKVIPLSKRFNANDPDIRYALSETRGSIMTEVDPEYKPTVQDKVFSGWTAVQIAFTNAQAGIEAVGRKYGVKNIESLVQAARSGRNQAEEMIAGNQYRIGADTKTYQGEGLEAIFRPISRQGEEVKGDFFDYLFNYHNMSRMTLEQRSMAEQQTRLDDLKKKVSALKKLNKRIEKLQEQIKALGRSKKDMETKRGLREELAKAKAEAKTLKKEATELEKAAKAFVPLENKPVLGTTDEHGIETVVTAEQSEAIVKKYEEAHPEFKGVAEKVWAFLQNLNQYRVDTGLISQDTFDYLAKLYPHYVPTYRTGATKGIGAIEGKYNLKVKTTIKTAKGSTKNLLPPDVMIARQVMETVRAGQINKLANALYEGAEKSGDTTYIEIVSRERMSDEAIADLDPTELRPKNNEVVFFRDGERITMRVSKEVFAGFNAFNPEVEIHNPLVNGARAINNGFKRLVTSLNPAFLLRNTIRDIQDAGINTRYGKTFLKNYARASYEISHNGKLWQLYKAMGGFSSSVFDFEKGFSGMQNKWGLTKAEGNLLQQTLQGVENANAFVEQLPRLAEFISSIEAGNTAEQAILDSADVTTNFARMGNITKVLNRTLIPFLNPSIQGCSKMIRNITSIRSAREFASLALKAALVGVAPMVLNMLMYEDDEDYKNLRDNDKENNFLFKVGDTFVKIPRGRVASVIGGLVNRGKSAAEGEDVDWAGYVKNIMQQVTPVDSMSRTIFSPFSDVANNLTWYGSAIEGRQFENTAPKDRYDENTSSIAIAIGQLINYSPKKIHYLLDQYSGVIGDFILPATTAKAEKGFLSGNFTLDPATSNKLSTEFYEMYDQAQYAKTAGDDTAAYQVRYLNKVKSAISDMYKQKSEIQNNPDLSNAEKLQQTRVVQLLINEAYKTALQDFELYTKAIEATAGMEDENLRFTEATRLMYGAERALSEYNDDVYAKCQILNKAGVDYEVLYSYYFTVRGITSDKDYEGNTISGSKRKKVVASINGMNISADQKLLLICASGYALQDNDLLRMTAVNAKKRLLRYILNLKGATQTEKTELAEMCGFEVKNGRVVTKSVFSLG